MNIWLKHRKRIRGLLQKGGIKHFRWWSSIRKTMVVINPIVLISEILELIGNIHQKYHLLQLTRNTNIDYRELYNVIEIGGGYGAMCVSLYDKGFNGKYILYDFPEMLELQKYHISKRNLNNKDIKYTSNIDDINISGEPSLLIALWSLSEIPLYERIDLEKNIYGFDYYLIAFQSEFDGVDNRKYFKEFRERIGGKWQLIRIPHLSENNYYLIGNKQ